TPGGYSYVGLPSYAEDGAPLERMDAAAVRGGERRGMSGSHRADGLFMLCGAGIAAGRVDGAQIADMAPSILALCGLASPSDWAGCTLPCLASGLPRGGAQDDAVGAEIAYGPAAEAELQRR